jgi:hypothetical protein
MIRDNGSDYSVSEPSKGHSMKHTLNNTPYTVLNDSVFKNPTQKNTDKFCVQASSAAKLQPVSLAKSLLDSEKRLGLGFKKQGSVPTYETEITHKHNDKEVSYANKKHVQFTHINYCKKSINREATIDFQPSS